ncbi:hypothetical protein [Xanthobacter oligotrophicus]|uniref:hypothetical protein n=1 Tax=Xanthobacter oligotrophicus TaxID=2607286 RepID=UPI0011F23382|nr:hypothetical protein [Xanthobacter oligotrophicus]MCG5237124.1 hypothetical protein [Xanthobacter oligotrophicus]
MKYMDSTGLDALIRGGPEHLSILASAVRDYGVNMLNIVQSPTPFRINRHRNGPTIFLLGDDCESALGPVAFHMPSVRRAIRASSAFTIISCAPLPEAYDEAASVAVLARQHVMIVETRIEQEIPWMSLIQKLAPGKPLLLATVNGGHA